MQGLTVAFSLHADTMVKKGNGVTILSPEAARSREEAEEK